MLRQLALFTLLLSLAFASSARAQIFQPGTQPVGHVDGITTPIQSSQQCRSCHAGLDDSSEYEPWESWRGALMANAARDPIFRAALSVAEVDNHDAADFCVRCHSPEAWLRGRSEVPDYDPTATPDTDRPRFHAEDATHPPSDDQDGVSCMVCHRSSEQPDDTNLFNARLIINDGDTRYGPYAYDPTGDMPPHPTQVSTFLQTSRLCGQCHDISNPVLLGHREETTGLVATTRDFAIERTFSEWRASAFATRNQTCQSCHMPAVDHPVPVASFSPFDTAMHDGVRQHFLLGAASWQLRAIGATIPNVPSGLSMDLLDNADRIDTFMTTAATVEIRTRALTGGTATATIRVTNNTGHKLPTGYPEGRRMWLEVDVLDDAGTVVAGSARYDATTGMLDQDPQARTYDAQMGTLGTDGTTVTPGFHFVLSDTLIRDTRIPPEGWTPGATDDDLPLGRDYGDGAGGYHNYDEASYSLPNLCGTGTLHLRARLRYQATTREYVEFLRDHAPTSLDPAMNGMSWGQVAYQAWTDHGGETPIEMASAMVDLGASPMPCALPDAGTDAAMVADSGASDASTTSDAGTTPPPASSGCGCRAGGARDATGLGWLALAGIVAITRRRRR